MDSLIPSKNKQSHLWQSVNQVTYPFPKLQRCNNWNSVIRSNFILHFLYTWLFIHAGIKFNSCYKITPALKIVVSNTPFSDDWDLNLLCVLYCQVDRINNTCVCLKSTTPRTNQLYVNSHCGDVNDKQFSWCLSLLHTKNIGGHKYHL